MKKIITAINNPKLNEELKKERNFEIIGKDIQYREAILEILEKNNKIDLIILSEKIPGEIQLEKLIKKIKFANEKIKIIFILEKENKELEKILIKNNIVDIYYNNKINLKELIKIINKKEINIEEEIIKLKKIIEEKNIPYHETENHKINIVKNPLYRIKSIIKEQKNSPFLLNMSTKIITFSGNYKSGKSTLSLIISQYLSEKNYRVLLVDADLEKKDLSLLLEKNKRINIKKRKNKYLNKNRKKSYGKYLNKNKIKIKNNKRNEYKKLINLKNKIDNYKIKNIIHFFTNKINKNLYFFSGFNNLLKIKKNKEIKKQKIIKKIIFIFFQIIKKQYHFIIIDISKNNLDVINKQILKNSDINFILLEANLLGMKEIQRTLKEYTKGWNINKNSLHIVSNKRNFSSMNKSLIAKCIPHKNKILEIKENKIYYHLIHNYFRKKFLLKNKKIKKEIHKIINQINIK